MDTLMWIVVLIAVLVVIGVPVFLVMHLQRRAHIRAWSELAARLGLECDPGKYWGAPVVVRGDYQGHALTLDTFTRSSGSGKGTGQTTYTRIVLAVSNPTGLRLELSKEGLLEKVGKRLGAQDIQTGDAALDQRFVIKGEPEEAVRRVLTSEALRGPLIAASSMDLRVEGSEIRFQKPGVERDNERLRGLFDLLSALAREIERIR